MSGPISESYGGPTDGSPVFCRECGCDLPGNDDDQDICDECRYPDDDDDDYVGERVSCWLCHGEGGWHDCGEDCCPCLDKSINEICPECDGEGTI